MNLPKDFFKKLFHNTTLFFIVLLLYYIATWNTGCPIRHFLGIACPGCGMTRAWLAALRLDFPSAFSYHPLFLLGALGAVAIIFHSWIDFRKYRWLIITVCILFVGVYLVRLFYFPDTIVNLDFSNGVFYHILNYFNTTLAQLTSCANF